jgi:hypothetical protein
MKLKLGSSLIFGFGGLLAIGLSYWQNSAWYMAVLVPFVVWTLIYSYEEINKKKWHYRVTCKYFQEELETICKACPYWGLMALAALFFVIEYGSKIIYGTVLQILGYVWAAAGWLVGFRPVYKRLAYTAKHGKPNSSTKYFFFSHQEKDIDSREHSKIWPIFTIGLVVAFAVLLNFGTGSIYDFYGSTAWYDDILVSYGAMLAMVVVGDFWRKSAWVAIVVATKWSYRKGCPNVKFVEKVPVPAKPSQPTQPPVLGGQL